LQKPDHHTRAGAKGCPLCVNEDKRVRLIGYRKANPLMGAPRIQKEKYLNELVLKYGNKFKFDLSNYESKTKGSVLLICEEHGEERHTPTSLLISSFGCTKCAAEVRTLSKTKSYEHLVLDVKAVHGNKYVLLESNRHSFVNRRSVLEIECQVHGIFQKKAQKLLSGQGCFKCRVEELIQLGKLPGGYGFELFKSNRELATSKAFVYYLKINSGIYKIGITTSSVAKRISSIKSKAKKNFEDLEILKSFETTLENAFTIEQKILEKYTEYRIHRRWSTELFNKDVLEGLDLKSFLT
jgi:hypothetical protein